MPQSAILKSTPVVLCRSFKKISRSHVRINTIVNVFDYRLSLSGLISTILSYFCRFFTTLSCCRIFVEFSVKPVYPAMAAETLHIQGVQSTGKCICDSDLDIFTCTSRQNSCSCSYHHPLGWEKLLLPQSRGQLMILSRQCFFENLIRQDQINLYLYRPACMAFFKK